MKTRGLGRAKERAIQVLDYSLQKSRITSGSSSRYGTNGEELYSAVSDWIKAQHKDDYIRLLDVGANLGEFTNNLKLRFSQLDQRVNPFKLYCVLVEPIPPFFEYLVIEASDGSKHNVAIGTSRLPLKICKVGNGGRRWGVSDESSDKQREWFEVPVVTGDEFLQRISFKPNVIKVDVDGDDLDVLRSMVNYLKAFKPLLILEHSETFAREAGHSLSQVIDFLKETGYSIRVISPKGRLRRIYTPRFEVLPGQTKNFLAFAEI